MAVSESVDKNENAPSFVQEILFDFTYRYHSSRYLVLPFSLIFRLNQTDCKFTDA